MRLEYEIKKNDYMSTSASALLRIIQNNNTPILDLLTREVIQNSIDASLENSKNVEISVYTGSFDTFSLNSHFGDLGTELYNTYKSEIDNNKINTFIAFSDKNTTGLTGPINKVDEKNKNEKNGKFMNLVFNIGKAQNVDGSGGSWGYGKTVYYRTGIGLVIFYTRIKENNVYKSRLIMTYVEDERNSRVISKIDVENENTGIMWFGKKVDGCIEPLTDEDEISKIMSIFRIPIYEGDETGTTIIIPYVDEDGLLSKTYYNNKNENYNKPFWCESLEKYLKVSIQRWYSPRLMNPYYRNGPYLKLFINRNIFNYNDFLITFRIIQELYNYPKKNPMFDLNIEINEDKIKLNDSFINDNIAGSVYYARIDKELLGEEDNLYKQISNNKEFINGINPPIIAFCRKPGMILKYDIGESWSNRIESVDDSYIIGVFVANSSKALIVKERDGRMYAFEEYLRDSEKADHSSWQDLPNHNIIKKIQNNIQIKINHAFVKKEEVENIVGFGNALSRKLTSLLLPKVGYGKKSNAVKKELKTTKKIDLYKVPKTNSRIEFNPKSIRRDNKNKVITQDFEIDLNNKDRKLSYEICVEGEDVNLTIKNWKSQIKGIEFPLEMLKLELLELQTSDDKIYPIRSSLNSINDNWQDSEVVLNKIYEEGVWNGWSINALNEKIIKINCRLTYRYLSNKFLCSVSKQKENINE